MLVIEVGDGMITDVSFDTGEPLDVSVVIVNHDEERIYRNGEAHDGGAEEVLVIAKSDPYGYTDEDDEAE
jgi:hypothetical protein